MSETKREFLTATVEYVPVVDPATDDVLFDGYVVARFGYVANCPPKREVGLVIRPPAARAADGASICVLGPRRLAAMLKAAVDEELAKHREGKS